MLNRRLLAIAVSAVLATFALSPVSSPSAGSTAARSPAAAAPRSAEPATVVTDWQRTLLRTVYTENASPIPSGVLYLGFTSLSMHRAVKWAHWRHASPVAAAAVAAHDVLVEYFPASAGNLATDLATSLATVPGGPAKTKGMAIGAAVADQLIERRADDGRGDASIVYDEPAGPGVWQPFDPVGNPFNPPFVVPWLGFVDFLVLHHRVHVDGPDPITSAAYAFDVQEVKRVGIAGPTADRTPYQTETATFFNFNPAIMLGEGLLALLAEDPMSLRATSRLFARMHVAMADSVIQAWRLKFDEAYWRPYQAIQGAADDHNPATVADPTWTPHIPNPPYPDYVSGHASLTGPAIEVIRRTLGEETALTVRNSTLNLERTYATLSEYEFDAFHARIWGGLHFRDAMEDGYLIGHTTASRVIHQIR